MINKLKWTNQLIQDFWSGVSESPLDNYNFGKLAGENFLKIISPLLSKDDKILDFGAGNGEIIEKLSNEGFQVAAYETSPKREKSLINRLNGKPGFLGVINDSVTKLQFDIILMTEVIEHILEEEFDYTLLLASKLLKKNGLIIVTTPNQEDLDSSSCYCVTSKSYFHRWQHVRSFSPFQVEELFSRFGFKRLHLGIVDFSLNSHKFEEHKNFTKSLSNLNKILNQYIDGIFETSNEENQQKLALVEDTVNLLTVSFPDFSKMLKKPKKKTNSFFLKYREGSHQNFKRRLNTLKTKLSLLNRTNTINSQEEYDFAIGDGSTIIYVGKKQSA